MPYDYADLKAELALPAYGGMTDQQAADALNAVNIAVTVDAQVRDVLSTLIVRPAWPKIELLSREAPNQDATHDTALAAAVALVRLVETFKDGIVEMTNPTVAAMVEGQLDAFVAAGVMAADDKAAVLALSSATVSRASQIGWAGVTDLDVAKARAL
jgi:hypothetical protein